MNHHSNLRGDVVVAIAEFPPLTGKHGDAFAGFELDLWKRIALRLGIRYTYCYTEFRNIIPLLKKGEAQVGIAGISHTAERERAIDFSHYTMNAGLLILTSEKSSRVNFTNILRSFFHIHQKGVLQSLAILLGFIVFAAHFFWLAERGENEGIALSYFPGIFDALWWTVVTVGTVGYGDIVPYTWLGRAIGTFTIFIGFTLFGVYVAEVTSVISLSLVRSVIRGPEDLRGRRVATLVGTVSVPAILEHGGIVVPKKKMEEVYEDLEEGRVEAVVFDAPVLLHYLKTHPKDHLLFNGKTFAPQTYGFAFPSGSPLREKVNQELLALRDSGEYDEIYKRWFVEG